MRPIDLRELEAQFRGTRFSELVKHHLGRQTQRERIDGLQETIALLPDAARGIAEGFIDRWNVRAYDQGFWQQDTANVFDEIVADARSTLRPLGLETDDEVVFNLFNIVVLNYAYSAYDQPKMRKFMGITGDGFPWPSALGLLYPIGATIYIGTATPASLRYGSWLRSRQLGLLALRGRCLRRYLSNPGLEESLAGLRRGGRVLCAWHGPIERWCLTTGCSGRSAARPAAEPER